MKRPVLEPTDPYTGRPLYRPTDVVSATEATGLQPTPPEDTDETEAFAELYDLPLTPRD